jgi:Arc/MetJ-type ribon-helix-helix transcriptional regulator
MTIQVAVKLPVELVARLDELVASGTFPSRSTGIRRALEVLLRAEERRRIDLAFAEGFRRVPDDDAGGETTRLAVEAIDEEPWERWW